MIFGQDDKNKRKLSRENSPHSGHHKRRVLDDPYLTKELLSSQLQVSNLSLHLFLSQKFRPVQTTIRYWYEWVIVNCHTPDLGRWLSWAVRSR
jgi:hypothetical protein